MNREIKFKAWVKRIFDKDIKGIMVEVKEFYLKSGDIGYSCYCERYGRTVNLLAKKGNFELLQWTGLKDRNGTEIYEGDILQIPYTYYERIDCAIKVPYDEVMLGVVVFNPKSGAFGIIIPDDEDELSQGFNSFDFAFENIGYECKVINNRFKDKQLLQDIFEDNEELVER